MHFYPKLAGERVYLSPISVDDESVKLYTGWLNDPEVSDNLGFTGQIVSEDGERSVLADLAGDGYNFAIVHREGDRLMGNIGFMNIQHPNRRAECGLFIGERADRGKGYGREALCLLLRYGFQVLNFHNVMLSVYSFNKSAIACYEKVGFQKIGMRRNSYFVGGRYHNTVYMDILPADFYRENPDDVPACTEKGGGR